MVTTSNIASSVVRPHFTLDQLADQSIKDDCRCTVNTSGFQLKYITKSQRHCPLFHLASVSDESVIYTMSQKYGAKKELVLACKKRYCKAAARIVPDDSIYGAVQLNNEKRKKRMQVNTTVKEAFDISSYSHLEMISNHTCKNDESEGSGIGHCAILSSLDESWQEPSSEG